MRRFLLSPRWLLGHLIVVVVVVVFVRLGIWQLRRAESVTGSIQNFGYALEWPVFAACAIGGYAKLIYDEVRRTSSRAGVDDRPVAGEPAYPPDPAPGPGPGERTADALDLVPRRAPVTVPADSEEGDEELAAYNRYLAWLNEHPRH